jgi:quinol monooxygenase YgiN
MATILAHIKVKPGCEAQFEQISKDLYGASHGSEPGLLRYEYWRGAEPRTYYCIESYADVVGFLKHQSSAHHHHFGPDFRELIEAITMGWVDPIGQASPLAPTNNQPLPADATDQMKAIYPRFASIYAAWWGKLR